MLHIESDMKKNNAIGKAFLTTTKNFFNEIILDLIQK